MEPGGGRRRLGVPGPSCGRERPSRSRTPPRWRCAGDGRQARAGVGKARGGGDHRVLSERTITKTRGRVRLELVVSLLAETGLISPGEEVARVTRTRRSAPITRLKSARLPCDEFVVVVVVERDTRRTHTHSHPRAPADARRVARVVVAEEDDNANHHHHRPPSARVHTSPSRRSPGSTLGKQGNGGRSSSCAKLCVSPPARRVVSCLTRPAPKPFRVSVRSLRRDRHVCL